MRNTQVLNCRIPTDLHEALSKLAADSQESLAFATRTVLRLGLAHVPATHAERRAGAVARAQLGGRPGPRLLAERFAAPLKRRAAKARKAKGGK